MGKVIFINICTFALQIMNVLSENIPWLPSCGNGQYTEDFSKKQHNSDNNAKQY